MSNKPDLSPYYGMSGLERYQREYAQACGIIWHDPNQGLASAYDASAQMQQAAHLSGWDSEQRSVFGVQLAASNTAVREAFTDPFAPRPSRIPPPPDSEAFMREMRQEWEGKR